MTWSKAWESSIPVTNNAELYEVITDYVENFLPTRGWSVTTMPSGTPTDHAVAATWWIKKTRTCFGGVTHLDAYELWHEPNTDDYHFYEWSGDVSEATDSVRSSASSNDRIGGEMSLSSTSTFSGKWEAWISDQDTESFFLRTTGQQRIQTICWPAGSFFKPRASGNASYIWAHHPPMVITDGFYARGHSGEDGYTIGSPWLKYTNGYNKGEVTRPYLTQYPTISGGSSTSATNFHAGRVATNDILWFGSIGNESNAQVPTNVQTQVFEFNGTYYMGLMDTNINDGMFFDLGATDPGWTP